MGSTDLISNTAFVVSSAFVSTLEYLREKSVVFVQAGTHVCRRFPRLKVSGS